MKNGKNILWILALVAVLAVGYILGTSNKDAEIQTAQVNAESAGSETTPETTLADLGLNIDDILSDRILGDVNAPIRITEHSSFTCSHCGHFHKDAFGEFKTNYIDTGKAYLVFSDFPLNAAALHASAVTRCVPQDRYFDFVEFLFEQQENWAYDAEYQDFLLSASEDFGGDKDTIKACMENGDVRNGIAERMAAVRQQWEINSTPSFVINNKTVVSGASTYEDFAAKVEAAVNGGDVETATATPADDPAPATDKETDIEATLEVKINAETMENTPLENAVDATSDALKSTGETISDAAEATGDVLKDAVDAVKDTAKDIAEDAEMVDPEALNN